MPSAHRAFEPNAEVKGCGLINETSGGAYKEPNICGHLLGYHWMQDGPSRVTLHRAKVGWPPRWASGASRSGVLSSAWSSGSCPVGRTHGRTGSWTLERYTKIISISVASTFRLIFGREPPAQARREISIKLEMLRYYVARDIKTYALPTSLLYFNESFR